VLDLLFITGNDLCSQIHIKHINTPCGQNVELFNVKLVVLKIKADAQKGNIYIPYHPLLDFTLNHYHQTWEEVSKGDGVCCPALTMRFISTHGLIKSAATVTFYD
jgi:hypothetical protein